MSASPVLRVIHRALATALWVFAQSTAAQVSVFQPQRVVELEYFGLVVRGLAESRRSLLPEELTLPTIPFGSMRIWDARVRWADIEPVRGRYVFDRLDKLIDLATARGIEVTYTLGSTPKWASSRPGEECPYGHGCSAVPRDIDDWRDHVRTVVRRYRGKIRYYEIWNEPKLSDYADDKHRPAFFSGSTDELIELTRVARGVIRQEDPDALILSPGFVGNPARLEQFLKNGGRDLVDGIAHHFYSRDVNQMVDAVAAVRGVMRRQQVAQLPLVNTEQGWSIVASAEGSSSAGNFDPAVGVAALGQSLVVGAALGLHRYHYYAWSDWVYGLASFGGQLNAGGDMYQAISRWLLGATLIQCSFPKTGVKYCELGYKDKRAWVVWTNDREGVAPFALPSDWMNVFVESVAAEVKLPESQRTYLATAMPVILKRQLGDWRQGQKR